jgi:MinD superfamily P-loop ATPase
VAVNLAAALVNLGYTIALVDCDVDAPNAAILLGLPLEEPAVVNVTIPLFDQEKCTDCNACVEACRLHSLFRPREKNILLVGECNGCEACMLVCPAEAIHRGYRPVGMTYATVAGNLTVFTGALQPGLEESALVVKALKKRAFSQAEHFDLILVDTSPGTHCNVIDALRGADSAIAVTEPTPLGAHDLDLMLSLLDMFELRRTVFVNRADLPGNIQEIKKVADLHATQIETGLRLDDHLLDSYVSGIPVVNMHPESTAATTFSSVAGNIAREHLQ